MAFAFDSLGYAKRLRDVGVPQEQAEDHAEAAREFVMAELVTRSDLEALRRELENKLDTLSLRLTVRMGVMLAAGLSILAAVLRPHA
jgi:pyrroloquinoline quinone (PQQ) biosynthesis protein C